MILFNSIKGSSLNPFNKGEFRDMFGRPQALLRDFETLKRAKSHVKTLERILKEEKENNKDKNFTSNSKLMSSDEISKSMLDSLNLLSSLKKFRKVDKVNAEDITLSKIILVSFEKLLNAIEYNEEELKIEEISMYLEYRDEILVIAKRLVTESLKDIEGLIILSTEDKKEIANFLNNFEDSADLIVKAIIKENYDNMLDKVQIPNALFKVFQIVIENIDKIDFTVIKKFIEMFGIEFDIDSIINGVKRTAEKVEDKKNNFINSKALKEKLFKEFNLNDELLAKLLSDKYLSYTSGGYINEFSINGDRLVICNFIEQNSGKMILSKTMLFDEKGLVYEN